MPNLVESRYRDYLAAHLELIETGLTLVDSEMLLPNAAGAKGFVDLVARDRFGVLVLIEIKRSDSAARSAMHELFKYVALFREDHGLAKHQLRCILLSTTWHELLVPFSELLESAAFELAGKELTVGQNGQPNGTRPVTPIDSQAAISLCPKHEILLYSDAHARSSDIERIVGAMEQEAVADYFLIEMDHDSSDPHVISPFALYVVLAELSSAQRAQVQERQLADWRDEHVAEGYDVAEWEVDESDLMDASNWDHEQALLIRVNRSRVFTEMEIGYPDKLRTLLTSWSPVRFTRSGRFMSTLVWSDEQLLMAALSSGEKYTTLFASQASTSNAAACSRMLENVSYSLLGAKGWRNQVPKLLRHLMSNESVNSISIHLYSPCDLLFGLSALDAGRTDFLPSFEIIAETRTSGIRQFSGALAWDTVTRLSDSLEIEQIVPSGAFWYLMSRHTGQQWEDEAQYCKLHGLRYVIYEAVYASDTDPDDSEFWRVRVRQSKLTRVELSVDQVLNESILAFANANRTYLKHLANELIRKNSIGSGI